MHRLSKFVVFVNNFFKIRIFIRYYMEPDWNCSLLLSLYNRLICDNLFYNKQIIGCFCCKRLEIQMSEDFRPFLLVQPD